MKGLAVLSVTATKIMHFLIILYFVTIKENSIYIFIFVRNFAMWKSMEISSSMYVKAVNVCTCPLHCLNDKLHIWSWSCFFYPLNITANILCYFWVWFFIYCLTQSKFRFSFLANILSQVWILYWNRFWCLSILPVLCWFCLHNTKPASAVHRFKY